MSDRPDDAGVPRAPNEPRPVPGPAVKAVLDRLEAGEGFATSEVLDLQKRDGLLEELLPALADASASARMAAVSLLTDLGRPLLPPRGNVPAWPAPYVDDRRVVAFLVQTLGDRDPDTRNAAARELAWQVPDPLLRNHTPELLRHLARTPGIDGAALILGRTGAEEAARLLRGNATLRGASPDEARLAAARLGDRAAEDAVVQGYLKAERPSQKAEAARELGYLATPLAVITLARDLRTPETYIWQGRSRRSMRVHVIAALHLSFPTEPVFFKPIFRPENDSYYEAVEAWVTRNLGVTWDAPRPPFLHEEQAPIF